MKVLSRIKVDEIKDRVKKVLSRKYLVATVLFLAWILFFDENSIVSHQRQRRELREMLEQKENYIKQIEADKIKMEELKSDADDLEKFAREEYYMSKPGEEVFVVIED